MNGITDDVVYHASNLDERDVDGNPTDGKPMMDVLKNLARKIQKKYEDGMKSKDYSMSSDPSDPALVDDENTVTATPHRPGLRAWLLPAAGWIPRERRSGLRLRDLRPVDRSAAHGSDRAGRGEVRPEDRPAALARNGYPYSSELHVGGRVRAGG
jgi:hypothetical protein